MCNTESITIDRLLSSVMAKLPESPPSWPADCFAIASYILQTSGAYIYLANTWLSELPRKKDWIARVERVSATWLVAWRDGSTIPDEINANWRELHNNRATPLYDIERSPKLQSALFFLLAAADSSFRRSISFPGMRAAPSKALIKKRQSQVNGNIAYSQQKEYGASLCTPELFLNFPLLRVLPKYHTPQQGLSIRSLSHNLALFLGTEVIPKWLPVLSTGRQRKSRVMNILLAPWPLSIQSDSFRPIQTEAKMPQVAEGFGFFEIFREPNPETVTSWLDSLLRVARKESGVIDIVVLPEAALAKEEFDKVKLWADTEKVSLICGVFSSSPQASVTSSSLGANYVCLSAPPKSSLNTGGAKPEPGAPTCWEQGKHHRWRLDRSQIENYRISSRLHPQKIWWEGISIRNRELKFFEIDKELCMTVLICEDLAQQEPIADLVRAVGPNLVIALLMDGPQLLSRWPARYASVLADDPGSSVLTFTSLGMCLRSVPSGKTALRTIGLWREPSGKNIEITLRPESDGAVMNLLIEESIEFTLDGRVDHWLHGRVSCSGVVELQTNWNLGVPAGKQSVV